VIVHSAPPESGAAWFHWYVEVLPRLSVVAGFEMGTGLFVNIVAPESAAARLRGADPRARA
jgi:UDPglucose--hexose-1-phosphate uridylyltransferase